MIYILYALMLAIAVNIDSFFSGVTYGIKEIKVPLICRIIISVITLILSYFSFYGTLMLREYFPVELSKILGAAILMVMGLIVIIKVIRDGIKNSEVNYYETIDYDKSKSINIVESIALTFVLSVDIISMNVATCLNGLNTIWIPILTAIFQFISLGFGIILGKKSKKLLERNINNYIINLIPGIILILIGIFRII